MTLALALFFACSPEAVSPNRWAFDPPTEPLGSSDWVVGEVVPDLQLMDQYGDPVSLHQFRGKAILLDVMAQWCVPCQGSAPAYQELWTNREVDGLVVVAAMNANIAFQEPETADLQAWEAEFGLTHPVVRAPDDDLPQSGSVPTAYYIGRDLKLVAVETGWDGAVPVLVDTWIDGDPASTEICGDGLDNDADLTLDCGDSDCTDASGCEPNIVTGNLPNCAGPLLVDSFLVEATSVITVTVDTVSAATTFDPQLYLARTPGVYTNPIVLADDDFECAFPPPAFSCPQATLAAGTYEIGVGRGSVDGCVSGFASYAFEIAGQATITPVLDNQSGLEP